MSSDLTVLICSHNPKNEYLTAVLESLKQQTLTRGRWEVLLIDNASAERLSHRFDLSWHPAGRHLFVGELGKTHALMQGITEAAGEIIVVVDDDNVLAHDYLAEVTNIFTDNPFMGVVGGIIEGEFEVTPPEWITPFLWYLAIINLGNKPLYALVPGLEIYTPPGAGMAIRKHVAQHYSRQVRNDQVRRGLDPVGNVLSRAGDTDMALCAFEVGLAKGYFPQLRLKHLIPASRLEPGYIQRLIEGTEYSLTLLSLVRGLIKPQAGNFLSRQFYNLRWKLKNWKAHPYHFLMEQAKERGRVNAHSFYLASASSIKHS